MHVLRQQRLFAAAIDTETVNSTHQPQVRGNITRGIVNYVEKPKHDGPLYLNVYTQEEKPSNLELTETEVNVHDVRPYQAQLSLEKNGFGLYKLEVPHDLDWESKEQVESVYYPLVDKLLRKVAKGSTRTHIFDHTLRNGQLKDKSGEKVEVSKAVTQPNQPVGMAHVDYTADSGIDRLDALLPKEAKKLRQTPFAVIQVWRPLVGPVRSSPLGMIDANTVERSDLTPYQINFPGRTGYNLAVHYNEKHRWYYADQMETDEAYVFVCYDSRQDRARFTPHTGFRDLSVGPEAPDRQSVELRAYVFWENDEPSEVSRAW